VVNVLRSFFEAPAIDKKIIDVGFAVKPKGIFPLNGVARLEVLATDLAHPAGAGSGNLETMARGRSVDGVWTIRIAELPEGVDATVLDDIFLLLNYEYAPIRTGV
jgi:hypothetical protein